jgi:hypothetical protein
MSTFYATLEKDGWKLDTAAELLAAEPGCIDPPDLYDRENMVPGDSAKLSFSFTVSDGAGGRSPANEWMWVEVTRREGGSYVGELQMGAILSDDESFLDTGLEVRFDPEHVIAMQRPGDPNPFMSGDSGRDK